MALTPEYTEPPATESAVAGPPSLPARVVQVFVSPAQLFDRLAERPLWLMTLFLGGLMVVAGIVAVPADVWAEFFRAQMLEAGQPVPEGIEAGGNLFRIFGAIGGVIFWFVWAFAVAGIATVIFAFLLGDDVRFKQVLSATSHSLLIVAIGGLLILPLRIAQRDPQLVLSVGTFFPFLEGYPAAFLGSLDLFALWAFAVLGLAVSRFDSNRSPGVAITVLLGVFIALMSVLSIFQA
jgi:hypothetical protein